MEFSRVGSAYNPIHEGAHIKKCLRLLPIHYILFDSLQVYSSNSNLKVWVYGEFARGWGLTFVELRRDTFHSEPGFKNMLSLNKFLK